jgi:tetratricopeptide repeat protein 30
MCIVNLVIGTLYCSKGSLDFGISLIIKSIDPVKTKLGTDTWYYTKRCLLALVEKVIKGQFTFEEQFYLLVINFLDEAYKHGKNITTLIFAEKNEKQKSTVSYEAKFFKKIFLKLKGPKTGGKSPLEGIKEIED